MIIPRRPINQEIKMLYVIYIWTKRLKLGNVISEIKTNNFYLWNLMSETMAKRFNFYNITSERSHKTCLLLMKGGRETLLLNGIFFSRNFQGNIIIFFLTFHNEVCLLCYCNLCKEFLSEICCTVNWFIRRVVQSPFGISTRIRRLSVSEACGVMWTN